MEHRQRLGLAAGPIEGEHQLPAQPLAQRMLSHQPLQLRAQAGVLANCQFCLDPVLDRQQAQRFEPLDLEPGKRLKLQIGQRPTTPQRLRLAQQHRRPARIPLGQRIPADGHPLLEHLQVQLTWLNPQHVPTGAGQYPRRAVGQDLAQPGNLHPQHPLRRFRRLIAEQFLGELVNGDDRVRVAQQQRQQRPLPGPADPHQRSFEPDLQRPEDPELQPSAHVDPCPSVLRTGEAG